MSVYSRLIHTTALSLLTLALLASSLIAADRTTKPLGRGGNVAGLIGLPKEGKPKEPTGPSGPVVRIPGIRVDPRLPKLPTEPAGPIVVEANVPTVAPAQLQVLRNDGKWALERNFQALKQFKFRWSRMDQNAVSARWELGQIYQTYQPPYHPPTGHKPPKGPQGILLAAGPLMLPPPGEKQEFFIDFAKYLPATTSAAVSQFQVKIVLFDRAGKRMPGGSNYVKLYRLLPQLKVTGYQRFEGNFQANEPAIDAFIRATIVNQSGEKYEGGGKFEFYAKKNGGAPVKIGDGQILAIEPGQTTTVFAVRPVEDWHKSDANSQFTYECKLVP